MSVFKNFDLEKLSFKKVLGVILGLVFLCNFCISNCFAMLGRGYKLDVHAPHGVNDLTDPKFKHIKRHIHVSKDGKRWTENVDQTSSHGGGNLSDSDDDNTGHYLPKDIKEKARSHPKTQTAREQEEERQAELKKIERAMKRKAWIESNLDEIKDVLKEATKIGLKTITVAGVTIGVMELMEMLFILCLI